MALPGFGSISCIIHMIAKIPPAAGALVGGGRIGKGRSEGSGSAKLERSNQGVGTVGRALFASMPMPQSRWRLFTATWGVQIVVAFSIVNLPLMFPGRFSKTLTTHHDYLATNLVAYQPSVSRQAQPPRVRFSVMRSNPVTIERPTTKLVLPTPEPKKSETEIKAPELKIESKIPDMPLASTPKVVVTNTFSSGSSAVPTTGQPATTVQTGGFGDPNGVQARASSSAVNVGGTGAFDLPSGPGHGNGQGGAHGNPGVVVSAGFGNGVAMSGPRSGGVVQPSGFNVAAVEEPRKKLASTSSLPTTSVEILFKPKPNYTEEARKLGVDGEVRLEVMFTVSGEVHVVKVLQGLGHGLDEQAVRVAEQMRFKPAMRGGQPVDSTAVVHIVFQLAS